MHKLTFSSRNKLSEILLAAMRGLAVSACLLLFARAGFCGTFVAWGPTTYVRSTGDPVTVTNTFSVRNPATQYTLHIVNGGLTDTEYELVSSSIVTVNGVQVVGPSNFNQNVYVVDVPLTLLASNTIAVQVRGQPGGALSIEVIGVDNDPPTISATSAPSPNAKGWNNSDVTVTFTCSDATSGVASCPAAQTVSTEGQGQTVTGTATDNAGNTTTATATINLDETPPSLMVTMPAGGGTVSSSPLTLSGSAMDALSGLDTVTCAGLAASLSGTNFACQVSLVQGANSIMVTATDRAGNSAMQTLAVTLGQELSPPPNSVQITPNAMGLVVGEPREIALVDDFGRTLTGASWTLSDPSVAQISTDTGVVLTGLAAGAVTITASFQNFTAQAQATVFAGPDLPQGTIRWSIQPAPGFVTVQILQAQPVENGPDLYAIEDGEAEGVIVRALTVDGRELWQAHLPGTVPLAATTTSPYTAADSGYVTNLFLENSVPDSLGGTVLRFQDDMAFSWLIRVDGGTHQESWRYASSAFLYPDAAMHPQGSMYIVQEARPAFSSELLGLDLASGAIQNRIALPSGPFGFSTHVAKPGAPMIAPDGSVYMETELATLVFGSPGSYDDNVNLLRIPPVGGATSTNLTTFHAEVPNNSIVGTTSFATGEVIPDGQGGVLAAWTRGANDFTTVPEAHLTHASSSGSNDYTLPFAGWGVGSFQRGPDRSLVLGENGAAFALMPSNSIGIPGTGVMSFDIGSGAVNWTWQAPSGSAEMVAATSGNGLVAKMNSQNSLGQQIQQVVRLDSTGQVIFDTWTGSSVQYAQGDIWCSLGSTETVFADGLTWPNSSFPEPAVAVAGEAYHHFDFELFFCSANLCSPNQDVAFVYRQDNPSPPVGKTNPTTNLIPQQQTTIRAEAFKAFKDAFADYPTIRVGIAANGTPTVRRRQILVVGDLAPLLTLPDGTSSVPCGTTRDPGFSIVSLDYYLTNMEQAQFALGVQIAGPTPDNQATFDNLVHAIGRGIGNTAAHEAGHQLGLLEQTTTGVYEGGSCDGTEDPAPFTGKSTEGVPIHWGDQAAQFIKNKVFAP